MGALPNKLIIGDPENPSFVFENAIEGSTVTDGILDVGGVFAVDVIGDELSIDTVVAHVRYGAPQLPPIYENEVYVSPDGTIYVDNENFFYYAQKAIVGPAGAQTGDLRSIAYGTPMRWECGGRVMAAFYLKQPKRVKRWEWELTAVSGVGLLDNQDHPGGVYTGQTFETVVTDIVGGLFPFTVAEALRGQEVYNWLPYDTRRENLHRLLLALGASMRRDENGRAMFVFLTASAPLSVPLSRVAVDGDVDYDAPATRAEVVEHAYAITEYDETVTLFDNTNSGSIAANAMVKFREGVPIHSLAVEGSLTIDESGVNYAVVSGVGVLTGKRYTHTTRTVAADSGAAGVENVKHLRDDFTLVSLANSLNVARRLLAFYSGARTVRARLLLDGERCGDVLNVSDPFFEPMTAFLQSADVNASSNLLASSTLIENYVPANQGNNVTGHATLTGKGTWISPVTGTITAFLFSGGQGGSGGYDGAEAATPTPKQWQYYSSLDGDLRSQGYLLRAADAKAGEGGQPGEPGSGGRVLIVTMSVTEGQEIAYDCGAGGEGGQPGAEPTAGALGTDTTFGGYTTADGTTSEAGVIDPIDGAQYAQKGRAGVAGGDGVGFKTNADGELYLATPEPITVDGVQYAAGQQGAHAEEIQWNVHGYYRYGNFGYFSEGGFGGGPAYKSAGANGQDGGGSIGGYYPVSAVGVPGPGGDGADAVAPDDEQTLGRGGAAGNGGGGAGAFGTGITPNENSPDTPASYVANGKGGDWQQWGRTSMTIGTPARGGSGSVGGKGANGGIRIFWGG